MVQYECIRCNYTTDQKTRMKLHIHKKTPCPPEKSDVDVLDFEDEILNRTESKKDLLDRIKQLELEIQLHNKQVWDLKNENKILKQENSLLKSQQPSELFVEKRNSMYILQEREFLNLRQPVYKIGITETIHNRMGQYPKGSKIICVITVDGDPEALCLQKFRTLFIPRTDIGY